MCGQFIAEYQRKARKNHQCEACNVPIPRGYVYIKTFEKDGDDVSGGKWHLECRDVFNNALYNEGEDCMDPWLTWEDGMPPDIKQKYFIGPLEQQTA